MEYSPQCDLLDLISRICAVKSGKIALNVSEGGTVQKYHTVTNNNQQQPTALPPGHEGARKSGDPHVEPAQPSEPTFAKLLS
jgi:hypothetical protein